MDSLFIILVTAVVAILAIVVLKYLVQWWTGINGVKERLDKLNENQERVGNQLGFNEGFLRDLLDEQQQGNEIVKLILRQLELEDLSKQMAKKNYLFEELYPESNEERKE